jgi:hypothetical protein
MTGGPLYCTQEDVQEAMQEADRSFGDQPLSTEEVDAARASASRWFNSRTDAHFYDAGGTTDLSDSTRTAADVRLSVPETPHRPNGFGFRAADAGRTHVVYPNPQVGRYARVSLPAYYVQSVDRLAVREFGGETTDWVAAADKIEGRGEDYYVTVDGSDNYGRSYLYVDVASLGPHLTFEDVITADFSYGLDWQETPWPDVRRGVAHLAAAELTKDDDLLANIPEGATLTSVDTKAEMHMGYAMDSPGYLADYMTRPIR